jgi:NAD-dependent DNA ligase
LDGVSALYTTENKEPKLYTRGNGLVGQDISHLIPYLAIPSAPQASVVGLVIRGEIIIKKQVFLSKYAKEFANPRNFVAGIINKKTPDLEKYKDLSFVSYEVIKPILKPSEQFALLEQYKEQSVEVAKHITLQPDALTNERLSEVLIQWRAEYEYEIDGIICIDDKIYPRTTGNPDHAFAFKMVLSDQIAEAKVVDVIWTPSKDGYLKPRVRIEPITLGGVEIEYATGFNARFIVDNNIGIGALIRLIRSGDVIPHITDIIQPATQPLLPTVPYVWNSTQVDIMLEDKESDSTVREKTISGFFANIDVDGLGPGNIKRIISAGYDSVPKIIAMNEADLLTVEGFKTKLAQKINANIKQQIEKATLPELMHASNIFGRGFGAKKLKLILEAYPSILTSNESSSDKIKNISSVSGMANKTAEQFVKKIPEFITFITTAKLENKLSFQKEEIINQSTINKDHPLYGKKWIMTGFRDKELIEKLLAIGSEQGTSVNKKVALLIVKDLGEENSKIEEAKRLGIPIMTPAQVRGLLTTGGAPRQPPNGPEPTASGSARQPPNCT